jgi:hypothetical protein
MNPTIPVSNPFFRCDGSFRESRSSRNCSSPCVSGRLHAYKKPRHSAATPRIVVEERDLHKRDGLSPVAPESIGCDMVSVLSDIHMNIKGGISENKRRNQRVYAEAKHEGDKRVN